MIFDQDQKYNISGRCKYLSYAHFNKGETILDTSVYTGRGGVILTGIAYVKYVDANGRESIQDVLKEGDSFGEFYTIPMEDIYYQITASTDCEVYFLNLGKILKGCSSSCQSHMELLQDLFLTSMQYSRRLNMQSLILSQHSIREKLMVYLRYQEAMVPDAAEFELPISLRDLAANLGIDRSAMMREIRKMNEDGLIRSAGRKFVIIHEKGLSGNR